MRFSLKKAMRSYFGGKLRLGLFWFALYIAVWYLQIELFYGPLAWFPENHPYLMGVIVGINLPAFGVSFGYLLTRIVTRLNYTGRLRRDLARVLSDAAAADPYAVLDEDIRRQPWPRTPIYIGDKWLVMPGHALLRQKIVGIFYEELSKSFLSNKVRLTIVDDLGGEMYLDLKPSQHPEIFQKLSVLHPAASNADHRLLRSLPDTNFSRLRQNNKPPLPPDNI